MDINLKAVKFHEVKKFSYIGGKIRKYGRNESDTKCRITLKKTFRRLNNKLRLNINSVRLSQTKPTPFFSNLSCDKNFFDLPIPF